MKFWTPVLRSKTKLEPCFLGVTKGFSLSLGLAPPKGSFIGCRDGGSPRMDLSLSKGMIGAIVLPLYALIPGLAVDSSSYTSIGLPFHQRESTSAWLSILYSLPHGSLILDIPSGGSS